MRSITACFFPGRRRSSSRLTSAGSCKDLGGIVAGAFFVIPSIFILCGSELCLCGLRERPVDRGNFLRIKPAVMAIVAVAVIRIGRRALKNEVMWSIAALAFVAIFFFKAPFPAIILTAGVDRSCWQADLAVQVQCHKSAWRLSRALGVGRRN